MILVLFLNGFVGLQWAEEGTKKSLWVKMISFYLDSKNFRLDNVHDHSYYIPID